MNNSTTPHQRKALADMSNSDSIQPNAFDISSADELLKPAVTKPNNYNSLLPTASQQIARILNGWTKLGDGFNKGSGLSIHPTMGGSETLGDKDGTFVITRNPGSIMQLRVILQLDLHDEYTAPSTADDGLGPNGSEAHDDSCGHNNGFNLRRIELFNHTILNHRGRCVGSTRTHFVQGLYHIITVTISYAFNLNNNYCQELIAKQLTRLLLLLSPHSCAVNVVENGFPKDTLDQLGGPKNVSRFLLLRHRVAANSFYIMGLNGAITEWMLDALPPAIGEYLRAVLDGEYLTAVRESAVFDTTHVAIIVNNLMGPGYSASVESKLNIFQEKLAKWCRIFLGSANNQEEFDKAYREIIRACGCDEDWMRRRAKMFGYDYQHP